MFQLFLNNYHIGHLSHTQFFSKGDTIKLKITAIDQSDSVEIIGDGSTYITLNWENITNNSAGLLKYKTIEMQKSGISFSELDQFFSYCKNDLDLNIVGLMAIPPNDGNEEKHFKSLYESGISLGLKEFSMGMSSDYKKALKYNATFLRIGSLIFGKRHQ